MGLVDRGVQCDLAIQEELDADMLECALMGEVERMETLVSQLGANMLATDMFGQTVGTVNDDHALPAPEALHLAAKHGQLACLKTFLNCVLVHGGGNTSTPRCVRAGEEAKQGGVPTPFLEARNSFGQTPVVVAAMEGQADCLEVLLAHGGCVDATENKGRTAIHLAALGRFPECVEVLLRHGAQLEVKDKWRENRALHMAAWGASVECLGLVAERGAQLDAPNSAGLTPLHFAATTGDPACLAVLLSLGADATKVTLNGRSVLDMATHDTCRTLLMNDLAKREMLKAQLGP